MTFDELFNIANTYVLPFWFLMIVLPKWNLTEKIIESYWYFLPPIAAYIYYLVASFDPDLFATLANPTLSDIATFFSLEGAAGAGWMHFLAVDMFVGRWIYLQGRKEGIWTIHSLVLCLFFAPVGLLSHIITAAIFQRGDLSEADVTPS